MRGLAAVADYKSGNRRASLAILVAHLSGAIFTFSYLSFVAPTEPATVETSTAHGILVFVVFAVVAFPLTGIWCERAARRALAWMIEDRAPTDDERRLTLALSWRTAAITAVPWLAAAAFFAVINVVDGHSARHIVKVALTTTDGGL